MGELYDTCQRVVEVIRRNNMDEFKTRGALAVQTGFLITMVTPDSPDDPVKVAALKDAARAVFTESLGSSQGF